MQHKRRQRQHTLPSMAVTAPAAVKRVTRMLIAALLVSSRAHSAHALYPAAQTRTHTPPLQRGSETLTTRSLSSTAVMEPDAEEMYRVEPFDVAGATVHDHDAVGTHLQAEPLRQTYELDGVAGRRSLLHGPHKLRKNPECNVCRIARCSRSNNVCRGHCRKRQRLFPCSTLNIPSPAPPSECFRSDYQEPQTVADFEGRPPDSMLTYDTAIVTVPEPYIGCARISNRPSGCPARGTAASIAGKGDASVLTARCKFEYYIPDCPGPLLPFGVCECVSRTVRPPGTSGPFRPELVIAPCNTTELEAGYGVGESDGSPSEEGLVVVPSGAVTQTWFSNFTIAGQGPNHVHTVTATSRSVAVNATLEYFSTNVLFADTLGEGVEITVDEEYDFDYSGEPDTHDYVPVPTPDYGP